MFDVDSILKEAEADIKNDLGKGRKVGGLSLMLAKALRGNDKARVQRLFKALKYNVHEKAISNEAFIYFKSLIQDIESYFNLIGRRQGGANLSDEEKKRLPNLNAEKAAIIKKLETLPYTHKLVTGNGLPTDLDTNDDGSDEYYEMLKKQADASEKIQKVKEKGEEINKEKKDEIYDIKKFSSDPIDGCNSILSYVKHLQDTGVEKKNQIAIIFRGAGSKNPKYSNPIIIIDGKYYAVPHAHLFMNAKGGVATKASPFAGYFRMATNDPKYKPFRDFINSQSDQVNESLFDY